MSSIFDRVRCFNCNSWTDEDSGMIPSWSQEFHCFNCIVEVEEHNEDEEEG